MTATPDSTTDDATAAAERLEQALERIATLAARPAAPEPGITEPGIPEPGITETGITETGPPETATPDIAERLDRVIAKLRAGLGPDVA